MSSSFAWLDTSPDEQRRVRELISLFTEKETLDSLGIGQIRDVFSNALFPGLSTIQTRAKYFLLVPWAFKVASTASGRGSVLEKADRVQRRTIVALKELERRDRPQDGIIGSRSGADVKTLPSSIYWNGLRVFGILREDVAQSQLRASRARAVESEEAVARAADYWHPTLPPVPAGFPSELPTGLDLTHDEAAWLRERILESVPESLVAALAGAVRAPDFSSSHPWTDSVVAASVQDDLAAVIRDAKLFSQAIHGASILYGLEVAKAYEAAGFNSIAHPIENLRQTYKEWASSIAPLEAAYESWDRDAFWRFVDDRNPRISLPTRRFVNAWLDAVVGRSMADAVDDQELRRLVSQREKQLKRAHSRLGNQKLLGSWGGEVGGSLTYRWREVRIIVTDIHEGLARVGGENAAA